MTKAFPVFTLIALLIFGCSETEQQDERVINRDDGAYRIFERAKKEPDIDRKLDLLAKAAGKLNSRQDTLLLDILDYQIYYHSAEKTYDSSLFYADQMIQSATKIGDTGSLAKAYFRKAWNYIPLEKHEKVLKNMYKSHSLYRIMGDSIWTGRTLVNLANAQDRLGDFTGSHQSATEALKFLPDTDSIYLSSTFNLIASTSAKLNDFDKAIAASNMSLEYSRTLKDSLIIYNNKALHLRMLEDYTGAIKVLEKAIPTAKKHSELVEQYLRLANNYYYTLHLKTGKDLTAPLEKIRSRRKALGDLQGLTGSLEYLTSIYKKTDPAKAIETAEEYLTISREFGNPMNELDALRVLVLLEKGEKQKRYATEFFAINDSLMEARMKIKNVFAKIRYDEEQKVKQIDHLKRVSAENKLEYLEEKSKKIILFSLLILLVLLAFFVYYLIREKHKKEKIKEVYSTEARISKKVHDELANDLFQIMIQLEDRSPGITNKLENVYQRTRDISKENRSINTGPGFPDELRGMINGTVPPSARIVLQGFEKVKWDSYRKEQKIVAYRSVQELLVNFRKHSQANILVLKFEEKGSRLKIVYKDNGVGANLKEKSFSGLRNMENRINSIGGSITFQSETQNGFLSTIYIPT